ncbi:GNAT family N-acetyltransferase [Chitinophaga sp. OAE865]|uniref:GNAT family N-acetyltransferase n=1 Tax=Chitinophaga sp. OAE865 TaxID=2817898 RepID=UPI001AE71B73
MEKTHSIKAPLHHVAEQLNFTVLLNNCCAELNNSTLYEGVPKYDEALANWFNSTGYTLHLRFSFPDHNAEVYAPLRYASVSKKHSYHFPVAERNMVTDEITVIGPERFLELAAIHARRSHPTAAAVNIIHRLRSSIHNMGIFLEHFRETGKDPGKPVMTFLEAEQLLPAGHSTHVLSKGREGFSGDDLLHYSPETGGRFQLHYFLLHPALVTEKNAGGPLPSHILRDQLQEYTKEEIPVSILLNSHPDYKVTAVHPWEAKYLLNDPRVKQLHASGQLYNLGKHGPLFSATASVRTVYNEESDWMFKFSLHVKITSAARINHLHELHRGYDVARLLATPEGQQLQQSIPTAGIICDPAFIAVVVGGSVIDGFSTSMRENPFKKAAAQKNVGLLASFCQEALPGEKARITRVIEGAAAATGKSATETAAVWYTQYLELLLEPVIRLFNNGGIACELHQQNTLLELDAKGFPARVWFRDNQSFLFRKSFHEQLSAIVPGIGETGKGFIPDERLFELLSHYLIISNLVGLANSIAANGLADESELVDILYNRLKELQPADPSGFIEYVLQRRYLTEKANLLTSLCNIDGGESPAAVLQVNYPNVLHTHFFSRQLIQPAGKQICYSRYFPKEDVVITLRPVDLDRDLEMLHEWFNREHAIKIWQMNWPLRQLETYYRTLLPGDMMYSYIGEANGEPTFNIEVYWAIRDLVGDYYDVLPTDYGTHQFIAPTDPKKKFASPSTQCMVDYVFAQPEVGKMVGEGAVDSLASMMNKAHVGFKIQKVIEMPHKKANLNFCYREWYWAKFPQNKDITITPEAEAAIKFF